MARSTLLQNYILGSGTLWEGFEGTSWAKVGSDGTLEWNTDQYQSGTRSAKLTAETSSSITFRYTPGELDSTFATRRTVDFYIYVHDLDNLSKLELVFVCEETWTKKFYFSITNGYTSGQFVLNEGWNHIVIPLSRFTVFGDAVWADDPFMLCQFQLYANGNGDCSVSIDSIRHSVDQIPKCLFQFDDEWGTVYTDAYPILANAGIRGTIFVVSDWVGDENRMNLSDLGTLHDAGWALGNHTENHPDLTSMAQGEIETELSTCQSYLDAQGFTRASKHVAYPNGLFNATVIDAMNSLGMTTGRSTHYNSFFPPMLSNQLFDLQTKIYLTSTLSLASAISSVDAAVADGGSFVILGHKFVSESPGANEWLTSDFQSLVNHIVARRVDCQTIDEWYRGLIDLRAKSIAVSRSSR